MARTLFWLASLVSLGYGLWLYDKRLPFVVCGFLVFLLTTFGEYYAATFNRNNT